MPLLQGRVRRQMAARERPARAKKLKVQKQAGVELPKPKPKELSPQAKANRKIARIWMEEHGHLLGRDQHLLGTLHQADAVVEANLDMPTEEFRRKIIGWLNRKAGIEEKGR